MNDGYYNYGKVVSREEFDKERNRIVAQRIKEAENDENLIDNEDLDFYLSELRKSWD